MAHFHNNALIGASGQGGYLINQSLRFNSADSAYLNRTPASAGNRKTWTWSGWLKRSRLSTADEVFFNSNGGTDSTRFDFYWISNDTFEIDNYNTRIVRTTQVFRDPSAWYHLVVALDTTQATASNRLRVYINGQEITSFSIDNRSTAISQNADMGINGTTQHNVGGYTSYYYNGYAAEVNLIDGTALTPSSFGETDTITGAWIPKKYSGSYGTNGFYLKFEGSGIGTDSSGNGNTWTANNFSTSGTGTDVMSDTPTNNWCTLNPLANGGTLANGNLQFSTGASHALAKSTFAVPSSGLWYAEATVSTLTSATVAAGFGLGTAALSNTAVASSASGAWEIYSSDLRYFNRNGTQTSIAGTFAANDVLQVAVDMANNRAWVGVNNTWYNGTNGTTGDPGTGANPTFTSLPSELFVIANTYSNTLNVNCGQRGAFAYTPPTGFKALNTANLPEPTIKKSGAHFNTVLWTGNDVNGRTITGAGFQPDLVWIKSRSNAFNHLLNDAVRGTSGSDGKTLNSNTTAIESNDNNGFVSAFTSDGFTLSSGTSGPNPLTNVNKSPYTYAAWNWKANGAGSSNTDGTITSTVSANPTAGFSIVTYTGNGTDGATVGHGLGVTPNMVIVKRRNVAQNWVVAHSGINISTQSLGLNLTTQATAFGDGWIDGWSSTTFTTNQGLADIVNVNANTGTYVAYCFSEVAGYSKFGSYTGNGSTNGPFVFCGFRPALVIIKRTDNIGNWEMLDNRRLGYNKDNYALRADLSNAEVARDFDILSNGFKIRQDSGLSNHNASGGTYIFAAFAELPQKYANAR